MMDDYNKVIGGEFAISSDLLQKGKSRELTLKNDSRKYYYSSGRCALYAILKDIERMYGGVLLPDYLCDSITRTVIDAGMKYDFYHVKSDFHIDVDSIEGILSDSKSILLVDYFGMTNISEDIKKIRECYPELIIIADCVQAFYSMGKYGVDYSFTSFRKWFPCPTGAMVIKQSPRKMIELNLTDGIWWQYKYAGNILKEFQNHISDSIILDLLEKGEECLDREYLCPWDDESIRIFQGIDLKLADMRRKENAAYLHKRLGELGVEHLYTEEGTPLFLPIMIDNRDHLRRAFFKENIFTPKHWPITNAELNGANKLYDIELSLICDQRYTLDDMEKQIHVLKNNR